MTLNWGYLSGTAIFVAALIVLVVLQIAAEQFSPFLYWATIVASTTFGTTMADFADRSLGIGSGGARRIGDLAWIGAWSACTVALVARFYFGRDSRYAESRGVLLGGNHILAEH